MYNFQVLQIHSTQRRQQSIQIMEKVATTVMSAAVRGVQCTKEEANTCCWGYDNPKGPIKRLYFKLPELGENEVRVKVLYTGLCHSDVSKCLGEWGNTKLYPIVPGHEVIGEVEKVGSNVKNFKPGDKVGHGIFRQCCGRCECCKTSDDNICMNVDPFTYDPYLGGYSTHMHVNSDFLFPVPPNLDLKKAPPLMCAGVTCYAPLRKFGKPGYRCGIVGVGGVGHMGIQLASKMGMHVVAISSNPTKQKDSLNLGAKEFVHSKNPVDMLRCMKEPLDIILNTSFDHDIIPYMSLLKNGRVFVQIGVPDTGRPFKLSSPDFVFSQKTFYGSNGGNRMEVQQTLEFCAEHDILPVVESYTWAEFDKGYQKIYDETARYRGVVDVAGTYDGKQSVYLRFTIEVISVLYLYGYYEWILQWLTGSSRVFFYINQQCFVVLLAQ
eukprot:TRINITY_DN2437_c0_g1_i1.p1 TRINITY_DN2437_c0_g1~~TRINITY_DN2437_c0_g1_i1.p1  ORF type:complete len:437 (+),score=19.78 TRINITY_DN2437_c0_g1_i1:133-1443(+)